jgi:hypothetical protein
MLPELQMLEHAAGQTSHDDRIPTPRLSNVARALFPSCLLFCRLYGLANIAYFLKAQIGSADSPSYLVIMKQR